MSNAFRLSPLHLATVAAGLLTLSLGACSIQAAKSPTTPSVSVAADAGSKPSEAELKPVIADYKAYVVQETKQLAEKTTLFAEAIKASNLKKAQSLYTSTRTHYERIEPPAELFSDLDGAIDARADDFAKKEQDSTWTGFHRIEMTLFRDKTTEGLAPLADQLQKDVSTLQQKVSTLEIKPKVMVGGAAQLIEEVASKKIVGEENRYSGADLADFRANLDGSQKIVNLLRPMIQKADPNLLTRIDQNFSKIDKGLDKYKSPSGIYNGYENYKKLSDDDRRSLQTTLAALAEDLSLLRGTLGVE
jgi:iron uptake system component EfeO